MKNDEKSYIILEIKHHFDNFDEKIMKQTWTIESSKSKPTLSHGSKLSHQLTQQVWLVFIMLFSPKNLIKSSGRLLAKHLFLPPHDMFFPIQFFTSYFFVICHHLGVGQNLLFSIWLGWTFINPSNFDVNYSSTWFLYGFTQSHMEVSKVIGVPHLSSIYRWIFH